MKSLLISVLTLVLTLGLTFGSTQADAAKRLGGGKSLGMQRQVTPPPAKAPQAAPAQTPAAPAAAAPATPGRSWMGPLAGLAAGIGLAALASHFGFGEELANMMMIALLVMVVLAVIGFVMRRRAGPQAAMAGASAHQYSGTGEPQTAARVHEVAMPSGGGAAPQPVAVPEGFDAAGFVRNAKVSFIRLQAANDAGNLDDLREFTTPEMFAELKMNIDERGRTPQFTNVLDLQADVLEVAEEPTRYVVSVRFTGQVREGEAAAEAIDEIWHLSKPRDGASGWLLAGIQQSQ